MKQDMINKLVGRRCGIIQKLQQVTIELDDPQIYAYGAELCDTSSFATLSATTKCGGGGITKEEAAACCVGEAVERYCAGAWQDHNIKWATQDELTEKAFPLENLRLFSDTQHQQYLFPFRKPSANITIPWTKAKNWHTDEDIWIPAVFVYLPSPHTSLEISTPISTGLACHSSVAEAKIRGLYECIERDAIALTWLRGIIPSRIINIPNQRVNTILDSYHGKVTIGEITMDSNMPTYFCLLEGNSSCRNIISFGASCHSDAKEAIYHALREAALGRIYVKRLYKTNPGWRSGWRFRHLVNFEDHARFYTHYPQHQKRLSFLKLGEEKTFEDKNIPHNIPQEIYYKEITSPEIKELGLHVVKVWVPDLLPLHGHHHFPFLGNDRLQKIDKLLKNRTFIYKKKYNPYPHPMP